MSQDKMVQSFIHHRFSHLYYELCPHLVEMAGPDQLVGVSIYLPCKFWCWFAQLFEFYWTLGCCGETAASNDDRYIFSQPANWNDDWRERIGRSAAKDF